MARVELRSSAYELAAEHFRAAYRHHADADFMRRYAEAAERAGLYAEARDATQRVLTHPLSPEERQRLEGDVVRLDKMVQPGLVRVMVQVKPDGARVVLTLGNLQRTVLGPGHIYLKSGSWGVESSAKGFQSELRTLQAGEGGALLAISLHAEEAGPALAEVPRATGDGIRKAPLIEIEPEPEPKAVPVVAVQPKVEPKVEPKPVPVVAVQPKVEPKIEPKVEPKVEPKPAPPKAVAKPEPEPKAAPTPLVIAPKEVKPQGPSVVGRYGPYVTAGLGVVAIGVGGFFLYQAMQNVSDLNGLNAASMTPAQYASSFDAGKSDAQANLQKADYLMAAGGAVLVAGVAWWVLTPRGSTTAEADHSPAQTAASAMLPRNVAVTHRSLALTWTF